jgi:hypothetical protein
MSSYSQAHYTAVEQEPKSEDSAGRLYINRLNGELILENYISQKARQVLVKLCNGEITYDTCSKQQESLQGGNLFACFHPEETQCVSWKNEAICCPHSLRAAY